MTRARRVDELGRAFAGSRLQVQIYTARRRSVVDAAVSQACHLPLDDPLDWKSPLEGKGFAEYMDTRFLDALSMGQHARRLAEFWPRSGPRWDGLALLPRAGGVLLIEGKSYPAEMLGNGCTATSDDSRRLIYRSLQRAKAWCGAPEDADWLGPLYQYANRLAHVYFFREILGVKAWLVNLCFVGDGSTVPTDEPTWRRGLAEVKAQLELPPCPDAVVDVLLPALPRHILLQVPAA